MRLTILLLVAVLAQPPILAQPTVTCEPAGPAPQSPEQVTVDISVVPGTYAITCEAVVPDDPPPPPPTGSIALDLSTMTDTAGCQWTVEGGVAVMGDIAELSDGAVIVADPTDPACAHVAGPLRVEIEVGCPEAVKRNRTVWLCSEGQRDGEQAYMYMRRGRHGCNVSGHESDPGIWTETLPDEPFPGPCSRIYTHLASKIQNQLPDVMTAETKEGCDPKHAALGWPCNSFSTPGAFVALSYSLDSSGNAGFSVGGQEMDYYQRRAPMPIDFPLNECTLSARSGNRGLGGCWIRNVRFEAMP